MGHTLILTITPGYAALLALGILALTVPRLAG